MGVGINKLSCKSINYDATTNVAPNPNKYRFEVITERLKGQYLIAAVKYDGCTTHNGIKVMVFQGLKTVKDRVELDPHFLDGDNHLIARFPGTTEGLQFACEFVKSLI